LEGGVGGEGRAEVAYTFASFLLYILRIFGDESTLAKEQFLKLNLVALVSVVMLTRSVMADMDSSNVNGLVYIGYFSLYY
jgi:hypothetical protein